MHDRRPRAGDDPPGARAATIAQRFEADLSAPVLAAGTRLPNVRQISERVAMGRALWRELVIGFASQLGRAAPRVHPARRAVRPRRRQHADGRGAGGVDQPLAVGDEPAHRRPRQAAPRRAPRRGGGPAPEGPPPDAARARRSCASSTAGGPSSSCPPSGRCRPPNGRSSRWASRRSRPTPSAAAVA